VAQRHNLKPSQPKPGKSALGIVHPTAGSGKASTDEFVPWFSLEHVQPGYCVTDCQQQEKAACLDKLRRLARMTWTQIKLSDRQGMSFEIIAASSMKVPLPAVIPRDGIRSTYFNGKNCRLVGFREGQVFHIVWIDRDLSTYRH